MVFARPLCIFFRLYMVCVNHLHLMLYMYMYRCVQLTKVLTVVEGALRCCQRRLSISKEIKKDLAMRQY